MARRVAVVGIGVASAYGIGVDRLWAGISSGETGIKDQSEYVPLAPAVPVGEISKSNEQLAYASGVEYNPILPRTFYLGHAALKDALRAFAEEEKTALPLISASTVGGMCQTEQFLDGFLAGDSSLADRFLYHSLGSVTGALREAHGLHGRSTTLSTACSSSANAIMLGAKMIEQGIVDRVVVGGSDALSRFTLDGFASLRILSAQRCKPFDRERDGINIGEAAAYLVLEAEGFSGRVCLGYVTGYANANDAYHQTALSPEGIGPRLSMERAIAKAGIEVKDIGYVNAHGTGTPVNDQVELDALARLFDTRHVPMSSTKGYTGHTLAAAGALEAVISLKALGGSEAPPCIGGNKPIVAGKHVPIQEAAPIEKGTFALSNSFGFGGNCTSLVFQGA